MAAAGAWMRLAARAVQGNRHIALAAGASAVLASSMATQASAAKSNPAAAAGKAAVPSSPLERAKRAAARGAVDEYVKSGMVVGVGSGSTIVYGIQRLAELYHLQGVDMVCVPTSFQSRQLIIEAGLPISDLTRHPELDVAIDGADEVDAGLNAIKGGGACQTQEKLVAAAASKFVLVADHRKDSQVLGQSWTKGVPLEVLPGAYVTVMKRIEALGGKPHLRMAVNKAGPVITDNGNFVIDADFGQVTTPSELHVALVTLPGVVETGLFPGMAEKAYFGQADGSVVTRVAEAAAGSP